MEKSIRPVNLRGYDEKNSFIKNSANYNLIKPGPCAQLARRERVG